MPRRSKRDTSVWERSEAMDSLHHIEKKRFTEIGIVCFALAIPQNFNALPLMALALLYLGRSLAISRQQQSVRPPIIPQTVDFYSFNSSSA